MVLAWVVWGPLWFGARVVAHVDNEAAVAVLNSGYSKEGERDHAFDKEPFLYCGFLPDVA